RPRVRPWVGRHPPIITSGLGNAGELPGSPSGLVRCDDAVSPQAPAHRPVLVAGGAHVAVLEFGSQAHLVQAGGYRVASQRDLVEAPAGADDGGGAVPLRDVDETDLLG